MRFDRLVIENFGSFTRKTIDFSGGNFHLLYGGNEGGKSTLLNFMRSALFGYAKKRSEGPLYCPWSPNPKGSVEFTLRDGRSGSVSRMWNVAEQKDAAFSAALEGKAIDAEELRALIGVDRDFFANFSGLSYHELATGENLLSSSNLSRLIYGLSFGDADRVTKAMKALTARLDALWKPRGKDQKLNRALTAFDAVDSDEAVRKADEYAALKREFDEAQKTTDRLQKELAGVDQTIAFWERLSEAREHHDDYLRRADELVGWLGASQYPESAIESFTAEDDEKYGAAKADASTQREKMKVTRAAVEQMKRDKNALAPELKPDYVRLEKRIGELHPLSIEFKGGEDALLLEEKELNDAEKKLVRRLAETGFASAEPTADEVDACRKIMPDNVVKSAQKNRDDADAAAEDARLNKRELARARGALAEAERNREDCRRRFDAEFTAVGNVAEARAAFGNFSGTKRSCEILEKDLCKLTACEAEEERLADDLAANAIANGLTLAAEERDAFFARCETLADPIAFDALQKEYKDADERLRAIEAERERCGSEAGNLKRDLNEKGLEDSVGAVESELAETRRRRDSLWLDAKALALGAETRSPEDARRLAYEYETAVKDVDLLMEKRADNAAARGEYNVISRRIRSLDERRDALTQERDAAFAARAEALERARGALQRCGFDFCGDWSLDAIGSWREKWLRLRAVRETKAAAIAGLLVEAQRVADDFRFVLSQARAWGVPVPKVLCVDGAAKRLEDVERVLDALAPIEATLTLLNVQVDKYENLLGELEKAEAAARKAAGEVEKYEQEGTRLSRITAELDDRLRRFVEELRLPCPDPSAFRWDSLVEALGKLQEWREDVDEHCREREKHDERRERFDRFLDDVRKVARELGAPADPDAAAARFQTTIESWRTNLAAALDSERRFNELGVKIAYQERALDEDAEKLAEIEALMAAEEKRVGVERAPFEEFRAAVKEWREKGMARDAALKTLAASLGVAPRSAAFNEYMKTLAEKDQSVVKSELDELKKKRGELGKERDQSAERQGALKAELEQVRRSSGALDHAERCQTALASLRDAVDEYVPVRLALEALRSSMDAYEREKIPHVLSDASGFFRSLTGGVYERIESAPVEQVKKGKGAKADPAAVVADEAFNSGENAGYHVCLPDGAYLKANELSVGAREQLYLAIRLALISEYNANSAVETLPILGDDLLVQFDETRVRNALQVFRTLAEEQNCQIILMTHHARTREIFSEVVSAERTIEL